MCRHSEKSIGETKKGVQWLSLFTIPIGSIYGIFTYILPSSTVLYGYGDMCRMFVVSLLSFDIHEGVFAVGYMYIYYYNIIYEA